MEKRMDGNNVSTLSQEGTRKEEIADDLAYSPRPLCCLGSAAQNLPENAAAI
jgi:hypothetical protein